MRHNFHRICIAIWTSATPLCPLCRTPIERVTVPRVPIIVTEQARQRIGQDLLFNLASDESNSAFPVLDMNWDQSATIYYGHVRCVNFYHSDVSEKVYYRLAGLRYNYVARRYDDIVVFTCKITDNIMYQIQRLDHSLSQSNVGVEKEYCWSKGLVLIAGSDAAFLGRWDRATYNATQQSPLVSQVSWMLS